MANATMDRQGIMDLVETHLREARQGGSDLSPTELYDKLQGDHPEIASMSKPKFSAGYVRLVKQRLNQESGGKSGKAQKKTVKASDKRSRVTTQAAQSGESQGATSNGSSNGSISLNREGLRLALFDFASDFVHTDSVSDRIAKLQDIEGYVEKFSDLIECH